MRSPSFELDSTQLEKLYGKSFVQEFAKRPVEVFSSLPIDDKRAEAIASHRAAYGGQLQEIARRRAAACKTGGGPLRAKDVAMGL